MTSQDIGYYRQRAAEERAAARTAADRSVAMIHEEMAKHYEEQSGALNRTHVPAWPPLRLHFPVLDFQIPPAQELLPVAETEGFEPSIRLPV